jgi:uncharacterized membrane protein
MGMGLGFHVPAFWSAALHAPRVNSSPWRDFRACRRPGHPAAPENESAVASVLSRVIGLKLSWITRCGWGAEGAGLDGLEPGMTGTRGKENAMANLIAIGYPDETTAEAAADEARQLAKDLIIEPDAIAVIVRDASGDYHVHTHHHLVGRGASWGMWWGLLFGVLFFIPVFGMAIGAGLGALMGKVTKSGIDKQFQDEVRGMLKPGTSALFLMVEKVTPDKAVEAMSKYGGTVLKTSLSKEGEKELQDALHGEGAA